jgi:isopentenyl-diphosphate Delta-isomerase
MGMESADDVITAKAPGKLYVAGEYAVVEAGHASVLIGVNRFLTVTARQAESSGCITSTRFPNSPITWKRENGSPVVIEGNPDSAAFILSAVSYVERLVLEEGGTLRYFDLDVSSGLDDASGRKFGLGSSAAVTVATVRAVSGLYHLELDDLRVYQLSFLAAHAIQPSGSGGDIAAATFAGCIAYRSPDRLWLTRFQREKARLARPLRAVLDEHWPGLDIEALPLPKDSTFMIGWTGAPASTPELVGKVQSTVKGGTSHDSEEYRLFLDRSDACVENLKQSLRRGDIPASQQAIREARATLGYLSSISGTIIETHRLRSLVDIAERHGAAAKSSGAGGGDCGIAVCGPDADQEAIRKGWEREGIQALDMTVYDSSTDEASGSGDGASPRREPQQDDDESSRPSAVSQRKIDHIRLADGQQRGGRSNAFDDVSFIHHAFADMATADVDSGTRVCGTSWTSPFYINAMTGGSDKSAEINTALARAASHTGLAIASGSQHAALRDASLTGSFTTIREHTSGVVFANVGPTVSPEQAADAVTMLEADALQIHVNVAQEIVMPEGDRDFTSWKDRIAAIIAAVGVPVIVKEVGFGLSARSIDAIESLGAMAVDVSGQGGTDFVSIENSRRQRSEFSYLEGFGQSTVLCLLDAGQRSHIAQSHMELLASGGVRNPYDVLKSLALGARAAGVSGHFLHTYLESGYQALVDEIQSWQGQIRSLMTLVGAHTVADLQRCDVLITGGTREQAELLGVHCVEFARRS